MWSVDRLVEGREALWAVWKVAVMDVMLVVSMVVVWEEYLVDEWVALMVCH